MNCGAKMTTEAEEFKREEERFEALVARFCKIWWVPVDHVRYVFGPFNSRKGFRAKLCIKDEVILISGAYYFVHEYKALRALNDRLELALQGKMNGDYYNNGRLQMWRIKIYISKEIAGYHFNMQEI